MAELKSVPSPAVVTIATVMANLINKAPLHFSADQQMVGGER
jgi:hypothetical protein